MLLLLPCLLWSRRVVFHDRSHKPLPCVKPSKLSLHLGLVLNNLPWRPGAGYLVPPLLCKQLSHHPLFSVADLPHTDPFVPRIKSSSVLPQGLCIHCSLYLESSPLYCLIAGFCLSAKVPPQGRLLWTFSRKSLLRRSSPVSRFSCFILIEASVATWPVFAICFIPLPGGSRPTDPVHFVGVFPGTLEWHPEHHRCSIYACWKLN